MAIKIVDDKTKNAIDSMRDSATTAAISKIETCVIDAIFASPAGDALVEAISSVLLVQTLANLKVKIAGTELRDRVIATLYNRVQERVALKINSEFEAVSDAICNELMTQVSGQLDLPLPPLL